MTDIIQHFCAYVSDYPGPADYLPSFIRERYFPANHEQYLVFKAYRRGFRDYRRAKRRGYGFAKQRQRYCFTKQPKLHAAYWAGWWEAASERDRKLNLHGLPRNRWDL